MFARLKNNIETINGNIDTKTLNSICGMLEDKNQRERNIVKSRLLVPLAVKADLKRNRDKFVKGTRKWVFDDLESWNKDLNGSHCRVLRAGPDCGKTAVVARYSKMGHLNTILALFLCFHNDSLPASKISFG